MGEITHIFHVADIHIHKKIYERLKYAWDELIDHIMKFQQKYLLVIAGDIFEYKKEVLSTDIDMFKYMVSSL